MCVMWWDGVWWVLLCVVVCRGGCRWCLFLFFLFQEVGVIGFCVLSWWLGGGYKSRGVGGGGRGRFLGLFLFRFSWEVLVLLSVLPLSLKHIGRFRRMERFVSRSGTLYYRTTQRTARYRTSCSLYLH